MAYAKDGKDAPEEKLDMKLWVQVLLALFLMAISALGAMNMILITRIENTLLTKINNVVALYRDDNQKVLRSIETLCQTAADHRALITRHDTLLHLDHKTRKEFYKDNGLHK